MVHFQDIVNSAIIQHMCKTEQEKSQGLWEKWGEAHNIQKTPAMIHLKNRNLAKT